MAHTTLDYNFSNNGADLHQDTNNDPNTIILNAGDNQRLELPDGSYITEADMLRDGTDLILQTSDGTVVIEDYFAQEPPPFLVAPDGKTLTPDLIDSFAHEPQEYASNDYANDVSPVGAIQEIIGEAHVTHMNGTIEVIGVGTHIYQGDIIETEENGAVNIMFIDETTFAVSEDARLAIDEYVFDPATQSGTTNFSVLKGVFVFTSGLIGREDPDDVHINTPSGSIGIRGTIIAGDVDTGEITVIEGAIVLQDFNGNTITLSNQYETARFNTEGQAIDYMGELSANDVSERFTSVSDVSGSLFSSIIDSAAEEQTNEAESNNVEAEGEADAETEAAAEEQATEAAAEEQVTEAATEEQVIETATEEQIIETATEEQIIEAEPLETFITSDEITGSSIEDLNDDSSLSNFSEDTQNDTSFEDTSSDNNTTENTDENYTVSGDGNTSEPSFNISVTSIAATENDPGVDVARVTGNFTNQTNLTLLGTASNYYNIMREDDNTLLITLKSGVSLDAERPYNLVIRATNATGGSAITQSIDLNVININEAIENTYAASTTNTFTGTDGSSTIYDISQEFHDPEGLIDSYTVDLVSGGTSSVDLIYINSDGQLAIKLFDSPLSDTDDFTFEVTAHASDGTSMSQTFSYDVLASTMDNSVDLNTQNGTYNTTTIGNININADNITVFSDSNDNDNSFTIAGKNTIIKAGDGDDTFNINDFNYELHGDAGEDIFNVHNNQGHIYAGDDNDNIELYNTSDLETLTSSQSTFDGGSGYDVLTFTGSGNVNFNNVENSIIKNIEELNLSNNQSNTINLTYSDIIEMTDLDNCLVIHTDSDGQDTIHFDNTENHIFVRIGTETHDTGEYNVYTDGTLTLLVDTDATVTGIV